MSKNIYIYFVCGIFVYLYLSKIEFIIDYIHIYIYILLFRLSYINSLNKRNKSNINLFFLNLHTGTNVFLKHNESNGFSSTCAEKALCMYVCVLSYI